VKLADLEGRATISVDELASVLSVARSTAYEAVRTGAVRSLRIGRVIRIPVPALLETLGANGDGTLNGEPSGQR
jgi:excisionase family DNA binding protein